MAVQWSAVEPYLRATFEATGQVERAEAVNRAFAENASDDVIDTLDAIGSRVFQTLDAARDFLIAQGLVES